MRIKTIASGSTGNCYLIESGTTKLLIEAGIQLKKIYKALGFKLNGVDACLISHQHQDHCKAVKDIENKTSVPVFCPGIVKKIENLKISRDIQNKRSFQIGCFHILPLALNHDVECYGFLISTASESLFYVSDTGFINYEIQGLTHLMIETNHSIQSLAESDQIYTKTIGKRHLSIENAVNFIGKHAGLKEIHLIHLSQHNADAKIFKRLIQSISKCPVYIAS